jgi:hypothetical protein
MGVLYLVNVVRGDLRSEIAMHGSRSKIPSKKSRQATLRRGI